MSSVYGLLGKEGCAAIIPEGATLCEAAGLGPEDPLADACALAVTTGCAIAAEELAKGIESPEAVCEAVGQCGTCCSGHSYTSVHNCGTGKRCGCLAASPCVSETGSVADCCSGKGSRSYWDCEGRHKCEGSETIEAVEAGEGSEAIEAVQAVVVDANLTAAAAKCIPNDTCSGWCNFVMGKIYGKL